MKVTKELRGFCRNNGMKIYVSGERRNLFNLYDMRDDRLICNWELLGGFLIKGKNKKLPIVVWDRLSPMIHDEQELVDAIKIIKEAIYS
nr:MAG TPA: hypothetical protein [Caudoviricetes sp.]